MNLEPIYQPRIKKIDKSSIKTTTMMSFIVFGIILVLILWAITTFFINTYYSSMRTRETLNIAKNIENQYRHGQPGFNKYIFQTAVTNSIYIQIATPAGESYAYNGTNGMQDEDSIEDDIKSIDSKLINATSEPVYIIAKDNSSTSESRMIYGSTIENWDGTSCLYIIAPLYPDPATINVIRNMLVYISLIVLLIAIVLAYYLSKRLTDPIDNITKSAKDLSRGNYNVKFNGANFSETKALAEALNKASYEMEKTDFYQREIMANVSHDLKTPLTMIRGYAEKIIDITGDNPKKRNDDLGIIISETERLNTLVTDMMTVSNLQSNKLQLNKEVFDLVEAAQDVYESFLVLKSSENYEIHFHPCKPAYIHGDKNKIMQVMTNFVSNAAKYSGDNKYVNIRLKRIGKKVAFHCIDKGMGIPSDELSHVWDRYYRASANHGREIEGSGLGLSIVKGILTLHNASYGVNSEEGKGSDFWFEMDIEKKPNGGKKNEQKG